MPDSKPTSFAVQRDNQWFTSSYDRTVQVIGAGVGQRRAGQEPSGNFMLAAKILEQVLDPALKDTKALATDVHKFVDALHPAGPQYKYAMDVMNRVAGAMSALADTGRLILPDRGLGTPAFDSESLARLVADDVHEIFQAPFQPYSRKTTDDEAERPIAGTPRAESRSVPEHLMRGVQAALTADEQNADRADHERRSPVVERGDHGIGD